MQDILKDSVDGKPPTDEDNISDSNQKNPKLNEVERESADDSEDDSEILEESPCGRWLKRREEVQQRDIPGIDAAYLAMDTEEGVEVVWNEVKFSERKHFRLQEEKVRQVFDNLTQLEHPNIVKFHRYWMDKDVEKPRVIFITEYMSSGSLKQLLKKTKWNVIKLPLQAWKRWCMQILSALRYLHSCTPPIIHGNLTCDTIFIQHNGLVKIGSVAPDAIHYHVKTCRQDIANTHYIAPEYGMSNATPLTPAVDIFSFGICALEMAALEIPRNGEQISSEVVNKTLESVDNSLQRDFIRCCLNKNPNLRPTARELLFHPVIFEVHSLSLLCAHVIVNHASFQPDQLTDEAIQSRWGQNDIIAKIAHEDGHPGVTIKRSNTPRLELQKFLEDVRDGIYPLTAFAMMHTPTVKTRPVSPEVREVTKSSSPEYSDVETRRIVNMICNIKPQETGQNLVMMIVLRMDDNMNRQLSCEVNENDTPTALADELVQYGFINQEDHDLVASLIKETFSRCQLPNTVFTTVPAVSPLL
ncbi:nuclear receptor-binding protein-like [Limulus polyphemus]|uniref:Nuclear receptor-binding protein-like n=1 Tax=Limulus polyphemus TaxID=6850 RepID=A0ABM1B2C8_LIMPO|nr:nuclear receptor-binding protein-like [Limulus polyphemus]